MSNVSRICIPKLGGCVQEYISYSQNNGTFFSLTDVEHFKQTTITLAKIEDVAKQFVDEVIQKVRRYDSRVCSTQWFNKDRFD